MAMAYKQYNRASLHTQKRAIELYRDGMSANKIAAQLGYSVPAVCYWFKKHSVEVKPKSIIVHCSYCGKEKSVFPCHTAKHGKKIENFFCDMACKGKWESAAGVFKGKNNPKYVPKIETKCANCGKGMEVHPCRIPKTGNVYCDNDCQYEGMSKHFSGELSHNWLGGIACEPYCPVWLDKEFKEDIKERDNFRCQNPDCWKTVSPDDLTLHHIDYDKKNCHPDNLITLCRSCNGRANIDRAWHTAWYAALMQRSGKLVNPLTCF